MEITLKPTLKQHLAYQALNNPSVDTVFLGGGAGGGKSWAICESRLVNALRYPGYKSFIGREELKRLMQSTFVTFTKVCKFHKIPESNWKLNGQYNYIEFANGSRIDLLDLKYLPTDPLYERFGSLEYTDGAIEEAGEVHFSAYDILKSRVGRHKNREFGLHPSILITGNPKKNWTYKEFYKPWKEGKLPDNQVFIQSLYKDNPFTADDYGKQLAQIKDQQNKQRLMYGNWEYDDDPAILINFDAITDLFTNTIDLDNTKYLTADIARYGRDKTVIYLWRGLEVYKVVVLVKAGIDVVADTIKELLREEQIPYSRCLVDEDGVGGGVVDILRGIKGFVNNSSPLEFSNKPAMVTIKENYKNLKTQCYYLLADYINGHKIKVNCDESVKNLLIEELEQVRQKNMDKDGKLEIIGKDEVKENIGRSPDYSDGLMMRMWFELTPTFVNNFNTTINKNKFI